MCDQRKVLGRSAHRIKICIKKTNLGKCFDDRIAQILNTDLKMNAHRAPYVRYTKPQNLAVF